MTEDNGLFSSDGDFWLRQRRLTQPAFHRRRVAAFGELMTDSALAMLERWQPRVERGQSLDLATEFMRLTMEIVTRALFSSSVERDVDTIGGAITTLLNDVTFRFTFPFYPPLRVLRRATAAFSSPTRRSTPPSSGLSPSGDDARPDTTICWRC